VRSQAHYSYRGRLLDAPVRGRFTQTDQPIRAGAQGAGANRLMAHPLKNRNVKALMTAVRARRGLWDPLPVDQHKWQNRPGIQPLVRLWSWLFHHTIAYPNSSPYAIDREGNELHIENAAEAIGQSPQNAYATWREGVEMGIWRNGGKREGQRRLYICGEVPAYQEGEETEKEIVCKNNFPGLPSHVLKKIKELDEERQIELMVAWRRRVTIRETVLRELMAGGRDILDDEDSAFLRTFQDARGRPLELPRQEHTPHDATEAEIEARRERARALRPQLELFVSTVEGSVQTPQEAPYKPPTATSTDSASLLPPEGSKKADRTRAGGAPSASHVRSGEHHAVDGRERKQLPARVPPKLTQQEREAADFLFSDFRAMQKAYPNADFSAEPISKADRNDWLLVYRILSAVGCANVESFCHHCAARFRGLDRGALAKAPGRAPGAVNGPRSFGLILTWAEKYGEQLAEAAQPSIEEQRRLRLWAAAVSWEILSDERLSPETRKHAREAYEQYHDDPEEAHGAGAG